MTGTAPRPIPSALPPTESELAAWRALSRDEQLSLYRKALGIPEAKRASKATMAEVLTAARTRARIGTNAPDREDIKEFADGSALTSHLNRLADAILSVSESGQPSVKLTAPDR
jgi:hypothetical protein